MGDYMEKFREARKKVEEEAKKEGGHEEAKSVLEAQNKGKEGGGGGGAGEGEDEEKELTAEEKAKKEAEEKAKKEAEEKAKKDSEIRAKKEAKEKAKKEAQAQARANESEEDKEMREAMEADAMNQGGMIAYDDEDDEDEGGDDDDDEGAEEDDTMVEGLRQVQYPSMSFVRMVSVSNRSFESHSPSFPFAVPEALGGSQSNGYNQSNGRTPRPPTMSSSSGGRTGGRAAKAAKKAQAGRPALSLPLQPLALAEPQLKRGRHYVAIKMTGLLKHSCVGLRRPTYDSFGSLRHFVLSKGLARSRRWLNEAARMKGAKIAGKRAGERAYVLLPVIELIDDKAVRKLALKGLGKRLNLDKDMLGRYSDKQLLDLLNAQLDKPWRGFLWRNGIGGSERLREGDTLGMLIEFEEEQRTVTRPLAKKDKLMYRFAQEKKANDDLAGAGMVLQMPDMVKVLPDLPRAELVKVVTKMWEMAGADTPLLLVQAAKEAAGSAPPAAAAAAAPEATPAATPDAVPAATAAAGGAKKTLQELVDSMGLLLITRDGYLGAIDAALADMKEGDRAELEQLFTDYDEGLSGMVKLRLPLFDENGEEAVDPNKPGAGAAAGAVDLEDPQEFATTEVEACCATVSYFKNGRSLGLTVRDAMGGAKYSGASGLAVVVTNCPAHATAPAALNFLASSAATASSTGGGGGGEGGGGGGGGAGGDDGDDEDDGIETRSEPLSTDIEEKRKLMLKRKRRKRKYYHVVEGRYIGHVVAALDSMDGVGEWTVA
jgi:hypothetical protein